MEYALTLDDLGAFRRTVQKKSGLPSHRLPFVFLLIVVVSSILWINSQDGDVSGFYTLGLIAVAFGAIALYRRYTIRKVKECEAEQFARTSLGEPVRVQLDDEKLVIERMHHQSVWKLGAFEEVTVEGDTIYLWYSELEALIIPIRAFESDEEKESTLKELQRRITVQPV